MINQMLKKLSYYHVWMNRHKIQFQQANITNFHVYSSWNKQQKLIFEPRLSFYLVVVSYPTSSYDTSISRPFHTPQDIFDVTLWTPEVLWGKSSGFPPHFPALIRTLSHLHRVFVESVVVWEIVSHAMLM